MQGALLPVLGLVGTGVSAAATWSAGRTQSRIAQYNNVLRQGNAALQQASSLAALDQQRMQGEFALRQAEINHQFAQAEAAARARNAQMIRQNAEARTAAGREDTRRKRLEFARFQAHQRNKIAASGVVTESGSPLELLAETAGQMQLALEGMHTQHDIDRTSQYNEAAMEDFGARMASAGATADLSMAAAAARLLSASFSLNEAGIRAGYQTALAESRITGMGERASAAGTQFGAVGTLLTGIGDYATQRHQFTYQGVK